MSAYTEAEFLISTLFGKSSSFAKAVREGLDEPVSELVEKLTRQKCMNKEVRRTPGDTYTSNHIQDDSHTISSRVFPTYLGDHSEVLYQTPEGLQILNGRYVLSCKRRRMSSNRYQTSSFDAMCSSCNSSFMLYSHSVLLKAAYGVLAVQRLRVFVRID